MEYRSLWYIFDSEIVSRKYYATATSKIGDHIFNPGERIPYTQRELIDLKVPASSYRNVFKTRGSRIKDVLVHWCEKFEKDWCSTGHLPEESVLAEFREQMIVKWSKKEEKAEEPDVDLCTDESEVAPELETEVSKILAEKKLELLKVTEYGCDVQGADHSKSSTEYVKISTSTTAMAKFAGEDWYEVALPANTRTKLDFVRLNETKLQISCAFMRRYHKITRLQVITKARHVDKHIYKAFNSKIKNEEDVPEVFIKITCDPIRLDY